MDIEEVKKSFEKEIVRAYKQDRYNRINLNEEDPYTLLFTGKFIALASLYIKLFTLESYESLMQEHFPGVDHRHITVSLRRPSDAGTNN